ncbi:translocase [Sagittula sp. NFXS13]
MSDQSVPSKDRKRTITLGGVTLLCALGTGYTMQYGVSLPGQSAPAVATQDLELSDINQTSSALVGAPRAPLVSATDAPVALGAHSPEALVMQSPQTASVATLPSFTTAPAKLTLAAVETDLPKQPSQAPALPVCDIVMTATASAGAMVDIELTAPCHPSERVTLHHHGMMFTEVTSAEGALSVSVPALSDTALIIASFATGDGATAMADVPALPFYDRVAVQWIGNTGLGLHAREFGADYFAPGHIHADAAGDLAVTARGEGGFLTPLGNPAIPDPQLAEVYSFPKSVAARNGDITLTVEAEISDANCDRTIEAQTLEIRDGAGLRTRNLTLDMPSCEATGDFLVLKNLVEDLTIAAR